MTEIIQLNVPCDGCTRCCHGDMLRLLPEDNPELYKTVPHASMKGHLMLDHKPNGDCIYLNKEGCAIHSKRPLMCREMDCRLIAASLTGTQARKLHKSGKLKYPVYRRGKDLLREHNIPGPQ